MPDFFDKSSIVFSIILIVGSLTSIIYGTICYNTDCKSSQSVNIFWITFGSILLGTYLIGLLYKLSVRAYKRLNYNAV